MRLQCITADILVPVIIKENSNVTMTVHSPAARLAGLQPAPPEPLTNIKTRYVSVSAAVSDTVSSSSQCSCCT